MATHDYVIDNQSAPSFRSDLNNALQAIVTQNSNATAPTTTYANMLWYDTTANQIKKRNEANSAWVTLGTIDESLGTFLPNAIASQSEAEAGTASNKLMTPQRTEQAIDSLSGPSGIANIPSRSVGTSYQNTQGKAILVAVSGSNTSVSNIFLEISHNNSTWYKASGRDALDNGNTIALSATVPKNWYYRVTNSVGTLVVATWLEVY